MKLNADLAAYLAGEPQIILRREVPISTLTTFCIGGPAAYHLTVREHGAFIRLLDALGDQPLPFRILGAGSNLVGEDGGYRGILVGTSHLDRLGVREHLLSCGCGTLLSRAANAARAAGLSGLEELYGIPGTVGGALYMNAGAYGRTISDALYWLTVYDTRSREVRVLYRGELDFSYRASDIAAQGMIVISAAFRLSQSTPERVGERMREALAKRSASHPSGLPSAGCFFKRPSPAVGAGELIDRVGLRGYRIGDAAVSEKHAGFFVNLGHAKCADVRRLEADTCRIVREKTGVLLEREVEYLAAPETAHVN